MSSSSVLKWRICCLQDKAELLIFFSLSRRARKAWQLILQSVRGSPKRYIFCLCFLLAAELFSECYHNSEERAFALLVRKNQHWSKTTCLQLATEADAKSFFAHDGVQVSYTCPQGLKLDTGEDSTGTEQPHEMYSPKSHPSERGLFSPPSNRWRGHYTMSLPKQHSSCFPHSLIQLAHRPVCWGEGLALIHHVLFAFYSFLAQREASEKHCKSAWGIMKLLQDVR